MKLSNRYVLLTLAVLTTAFALRAAGDENLFPTFADSHTVALWLFDEEMYPGTTLLDAGENRCDLRLMDNGELVNGKFGRAFRVDGEHAISFAGFEGTIPQDCMRGEDGDPSGFWSPTIAPGALCQTLAGSDWTLEFWVKLPSTAGNVVIIDLGDKYDNGFTLTLKSGGSQFELNDYYAGLKAVCPTGMAAGQWVHTAFTKHDSTVNHFVDGARQPACSISSVPTQSVPPVVVPQDRAGGEGDTCDRDAPGFSVSSSPEWCRQHRFNVALGQDRHASNRLNNIMFDEMRLSDVVRYSGNFSVPASFARKFGAYGATPSSPVVPDGAPLRFASGSVSPVQLGVDKYIFIDDAIIDAGRSGNYELRMNQPKHEQRINKEVDGRPSVYDGPDGRVYMIIPEGYSSAKGIVHVWTSEDGLNFDTPNWQIHGNNDYVLYGQPMYGCAFKDPNPAAPAEELYKYTAWVGNRGICSYVSPDGVHWRRNESLMLPLRSGGSAETFYDDQQGGYECILKRDSSYGSGSGRRAIMFKTTEWMKPWPFNRLSHPYYEGWPFPCVTDEGPIVIAPNSAGQVYRTRAIKYPWAADAYLAFIWRYQNDGDDRYVDLGVSRDGEHWEYYADQGWYMDPAWQSTRQVRSYYGMLRRNSDHPQNVTGRDEIWQYAHYDDVGDTRMVQRLDGFVSLDTGGSATIVTRPLTFEGRTLTLNINSEGAGKAALLDESGQELPGFGIADCDPISVDSTEHVVTWRGNGSVRRHAGKTVRVKFELQNAKLFAFQFPGLSGSVADLNEDGVVNFLDFAIVIEGDNIHN